MPKFNVYYQVKKTLYKKGEEVGFTLNPINETEDEIRVNTESIAAQEYEFFVDWVSKQRHKVLVITLNNGKEYRVRSDKYTVFC